MSKRDRGADRRTAGPPSSPAFEPPQESEAPEKKKLLIHVTSEWMEPLLKA